MTAITPLITIPVYNHEHGLATMLDALAACGAPCLLVDDGSNEACAAALRQMAANHSSWLSLERLPVNGGKGAALIAGFAWAARHGYTHALQIDADGQHSASDIPRFLGVAREHPQALVLGYPVYDHTVPRARLIGRYATHIWVWINTLSFTIKDGMCGFRVYPLGPVNALLRRVQVGRRMDFDVEIAVRLLWQGVQVINLPTPVRYPADGVSHFKVWRDNAQISWMHTRLFFGMVWRLPRLLWRKFA